MLTADDAGGTAASAARERHDRVDPLLRGDRRMRRPPVHAGADHKARGRGLDVAADGPGVVEHVAAVGVEHRGVERGRSHQSALLADREHQLDSGVGQPVEHERADRLQDHRDRRLVVGADDRGGGVSEHAVDEHRLERRGRRHGVEVGAQEQGAPGRRRGDAAVQVVAIAADRRAGAVGAHRQAQRLQLRRHGIAAGPLGITRAGDRRQRTEEADQSRRLGRVVGAVECSGRNPLLSREKDVFLRPF